MDYELELFLDAKLPTSGYILSKKRVEQRHTIPVYFSGIIPNSFAHIFGHIAKADDNVKFLVRVSYLEIYNEEVRDLLGKDQSLRLEVKERPG